MKKKELKKKDTGSIGCASAYRRIDEFPRFACFVPSTRKRGKKRFVGGSEGGKSANKAFQNRYFLLRVYPEQMFAPQARLGR